MRSHFTTLAGLHFIAVTIAAASASAETQTFSGELSQTRPLFEAAAGCHVKKENFDSFPAGASVSVMPGVDAVMTNENAAGQAIGLPVVLSNTPVTPPRWVANIGNGRPAWSPWVIRPLAGQAIYAFGQVNAQGDWVRIQGFDAANALVVSVDAPPIVSGAFAGFVTDTPILRVVVTPLGNGDGTNGLDDLQVSSVPRQACAGDIDGDGAVNGLDLGMLLAEWGTGNIDFNCDAATDGSDLGMLLAEWGACP